MESIFVVELAPSLHPLARVGKAQEPVRRQTLLAELGVERFDVAIARRFSWSGEVHRDPAAMDP